MIVLQDFNRSLFAAVSVVSFTFLSNGLLGACIFKSEWQLLCDYISTCLETSTVGIGVLNIFQTVNDQAEVAIISSRLYALANG